MQFFVKSVFTAMLLAAASTSAFATEPQGTEGVIVSTGADYVSQPSIPEQFFLDARQRPLVAEWKPGDPIREIPRQFHGEEDMQRHPPTPVNPVLGGDLLVQLQREVRTPVSTDSFTTPLVNVLAQGNTGVYPPDPSGDVGGGYYVQAINGSGGALYKIFNTSNGSIAAGPFSMDGLGSGGACATGLGDGVVVFDQLAQRWLFTEFSNSGNNLCVYLSATANPVSTTWTRYVFTTPSFPDYPKYGVWPDAYYVGANEGPAVYALDRAKMLVAQPATLQRKAIPSLSGLGFQMVMPASINGATPPPAGAPGIFARDNDDERNNSGGNDSTRDYIELFTFHVNWTTPANSALTGPIRVNEAEFDSNFSVGSGFGAIHQPGTTQTLDPLLEVLMFPLYYRNFGDHESLVGNHVTQIQTGNIAGVRWFELRRTGGNAGTWSMYQQGTFAPTDSGGQISRWMGAVGMDQSGNIALGYSVARATPAVYPGLRYTGRLAGDPLGVMTQAETSIIAGTTSQTAADRWGDYHQMGIDPADGCTFWLTGEYMTASNKWTTRVASFRFDGCGNQGSFTLTGSNLNQNVCAATPTPVNLQPVTITVAAVNGFSSPITMSYGPPGLPAGFAGSYTVNPVTPPATTSNANLNVTNAAGAGTHSVILRGSADGADHDLTLDVNVTTQVPGAVTLSAPANNATNQPAQPLFSWVASQQVANYLIEISTSPTFSSILLSQTLPGGSTSFQPSAALPAGTQLYWRVTASNLCGTATPSATFNFTTTPPPAPVISVTPASISTNAVAGQTTTKPLSIGNTGNATLTWNVDTASADCATPAAVSWLSLAPTSGSVNASASAANVTVTLNATSLAAGNYTAKVCVHSNDNAHALTSVPVTFTVTAVPAPVINVTPSSLSATAVAGQTTSKPLSIGNTGNAALTWNVDMASADCATPAAVSWLSLAPTSGGVNAGASAANVTVTLDASTLAAGNYTAKVCVHSNDSAHALTSVPVTFTVTAIPAPVINVTPTSLSGIAAVGQTTTTPLGIGNTGNAALTWNLDTASADCASPTAVSWLSVAPASGSVNASATAASVSVSLNATGLAAGSYTAKVCVHSNDGAHALTSVPVAFTVTLDDTIFKDGFEDSGVTSVPGTSTISASTR
ncbi:MAG: hypothetical protein ABIS07_06365 [Dokdonella sp.]